MPQGDKSSYPTVTLREMVALTDFQFSEIEFPKFRCNSVMRMSAEREKKLQAALALQKAKAGSNT